MSDDREEAKDPIVAPSADPKREIGRAIIEAVAGIEPVTGFLTRLYQTTHPPKSVRDREIWQQAITERTNDHGERLDRHEARLSPRETLTGLTAQLVEVLARTCPDGLAEHFWDIEDIVQMVPDANPSEVEDAALELSAAGYLEERHLTSAHRFRPTQRFYEQFDHQVMGWNGTRKDAAFLASLMMQHDTGDATDLHERSGWPLRRFNPALEHLKAEYPRWPWRPQYHFDFPSAGLVIGRPETVGLRRFVDAVAREAGR